MRRYRKKKVDSKPQRYRVLRACAILLSLLLTAGFSVSPTQLTSLSSQNNSGLLSTLSPLSLNIEQAPSYLYLNPIQKANEEGKTGTNMLLGLSLKATSAIAIDFSYMFNVNINPDDDALTPAEQMYTQQRTFFTTLRYSF